MLPLSGDHTTSPSGALVLVMRRGGFSPSTDTTQRSLTALSASYEGSNTEYTTHLPSGLTLGAPTRFIIHKASWVIGFVATVVCAGATSGRITHPASNAAQNSLRFFIAGEFYRRTVLHC